MVYAALCIPPIQKGRDAVLASLAVKQRALSD
jgi:hypothetical protein